MKSTSTSQLQEIMDLDELSFRCDAGVNIPSKAAKIEDKEDLVIALIKNFLARENWINWKKGLLMWVCWV